nr:hypothetical protein B3E4.100 [imported] - Neurospora crassa [Neurospora crassa]
MLYASISLNISTPLRMVKGLTAHADPLEQDFAAKYELSNRRKCGIPFWNTLHLNDLFLVMSVSSLSMFLSPLVAEANMTSWQCLVAHHVVAVHTLVFVLNLLPVLHFPHQIRPPCTAPRSPDSNPEPIHGADALIPDPDGMQDARVRHGVHATFGSSRSGARPDGYVHFFFWYETFHNEWLEADSKALQSIAGRLPKRCSAAGGIGEVKSAGNWAGTEEALPIVVVLSAVAEIGRSSMYGTVGVPDPEKSKFVAQATVKAVDPLPYLEAAIWFPHQRYLIGALDPTPRHPDECCTGQLPGISEPPMPFSKSPLLYHQRQSRTAIWWPQAKGLPGYTLNQ